MLKAPKHLGVATTNPGKMREFRDLLGPLGYALEAAPESFYVEENGDSFGANALLKAQALMQLTNTAAIADDSGLVVDALNGAPGLYSARFSNESNPALRDAANRRLVLDKLQNTNSNERQARFVSAIALVRLDAVPQVFEATLQGCITTDERGTQGFGYDTIFLPDGETRTMAQLPNDVRYRISHRAQALNLLLIALGAGAHPATQR